MCEKLTRGIFFFYPWNVCNTIFKKEEKLEPSVHLVYLSVMWEEFPQIKVNWSFQILSLISYQAENNIKESFINCHSHVLHIVMENYKEKEEEIERLVRRLVDSVNEDVIMGHDQR